MSEGGVRDGDGAGGARRVSGGAPRSRSRRGRRPGRRRLVALALVCATVAFAAVLVATGSQRAPAATPETETMLTVTGRGWGHGIGLSQWGAFGYATKTDLTYREILRHYYTGIDFGSSADRMVRVLLNESRPKVSVSSSAAFTITNGVKTKRIPGGGSARIEWDAARAVSRVTWGVHGAYFSGRLIARPGDQPLQLVGKNQNGSGGVHYRGTLWIHHLDAGYTIVNRLHLESYLYGVVPHESPSWWPARALKVQAVAARSYAVSSSAAGDLFDVYCTTRSQVYDGIDGRGGEQAAATAAVDATRGVVATYQGQVIAAFFFSTSGGSTESIENVWTGADPVPYLKSVSDPYETQDAAGLTGSPYHVWQEPVRFSEAQVDAALGLSGPLTTIAVTGRGVSPRVMTALIVQGDAGQTVGGDTLRSKLGLRSTWFSLRTISITPAASTPPTIAAGDSVKLSGAIYPDPATGATATLHYRRQGESLWHTVDVATTPGSTTVEGTVIDFSTWSYEASPPSTTAYYLSVGRAVSPQTTVTVTQ